MTYFNHVRVSDPSFVLGFMPSFITAVLFPSAVVVLNAKPTHTLFDSPVLTWTVWAFAFSVAYELLLYIDGRAFDFWDVTVALPGSIIGGYLTAFTTHKFPSKNATT